MLRKRINDARASKINMQQNTIFGCLSGQNFSNTKIANKFPAKAAAVTVVSVIAIEKGTTAISVDSPVRIPSITPPTA